MLIFSDSDDPRIAGIPPPYQAPLLSAIRNLLEISDSTSTLKDQGFVTFIEAEDTQESLPPALVRPLHSMEGTFRNGPCLVSVILWGNSGAGVTIVCPDEEDYASEIVSIMKQHL